MSLNPSLTDPAVREGKICARCGRVPLSGTEPCPVLHYGKRMLHVFYIPSRAEYQHGVSPAGESAGEVRDLYARVSNDGYLLSVATADKPEPRWADYYSDEWADGELQTVMLRAVPQDLAARLWRHGTPEQDFSDGYTAWAACLPYAQRP